MEPIWVGSPSDVRTAAAAVDALRLTNDSRYWDPASGIVKVDLERWRGAQRFERETWLKCALHASVDRAAEHFVNFDQYVKLPADLGDTIEVGCGPFTQLGMIIDSGHQPASVTLADPLLNSYLDHPHCAYRDGKLRNLPAKLIELPAEQLDFAGAFDTLVLINVLEHVYDARLVLANAFRALRSGGILIFNDRHYDSLDPAKLYDVGHPIRVKMAILTKFLGGFAPWLETRIPHEHGGDSVYFIGTKLPQPVSVRVDTVVDTKEAEMSTEPQNQPVDIDDIPMPEPTNVTDVEDTFGSRAAFRFAFVGVGQAGGRLCESFHDLGYRRICAINTTTKDLDHLKIPDKNKLVINDGTKATSDGAGKDPAVAAKVAQGKTEEIYDLLRRCWGDRYDWSFVCFGAGGGTGAGAFDATIKIAAKVMADLGLDKRVGVIIALPKVDEGHKVAQNALATMQRVRDEFGTCSPVIIIDNERIKAIYPKTPVGQFWSVANRGVCTLLHLFNQIASQSSQHTTFDPADMSTLLSSGVVAFGATQLAKYESQADISAAIRQQLQGNVLAAVDLSQGKHAGCVFVGSADILNTMPQENLDHGFAMLSRMLAPGSTVHRGIYVGSKPDLRAYCMIGGLPYPEKRLQELAQVAGKT